MMARESDKQPPALTRRTVRYPVGDAGVVYVTGGGVSVVMPPSRLGRWYERLNDLAEALIDVLDRLDDILYRPEPATGSKGHHDLETPARLVQVLLLLRKASHVLLLAVYVAWCFAKVRAKHMLGLH